MHHAHLARVIYFYYDMYILEHYIENTYTFFKGMFY